MPKQTSEDNTARSPGLLRSGLTVSTMTLLSRIFGLIRDVVVAKLMGDGLAADVFFFANKIPNFLRRLFAEGAFAQAFVPVLTEVRQNDSHADFRSFIAAISGTLGTIVMLVTLLGVIASPVIAALFGTGWFIEYLQGGEQADKFLLASAMLKITFPYLLFVSLTALSGAILNVLNRFAVAAFTPVLLNVAIIACAVFLAPHFEQPAFALAWGVFLGGLIQLFFQLPFLYRAGVLARPKWDWKDPNVVKVRTLMIPALFGVSVSQINLLLDTVIASFLVTGSISWLYYSDRLLEFPLGLFGIAIATVILPALSKDYVKAQPEAFQNNMDWGVRTVCFVGIPAAIGLGILAEPMLKIIFERGAFTATTAQMASFSLTAYALGLVAFMLIKVLATGFYSRQNTKTPVKYGIIAMVANMIFNLSLVFSLGYVGLALATSLSGWLNAGLLYRRLGADNVYVSSPLTKVFLLRVLLASSAMSVALLWLKKNVLVLDVNLFSSVLQLVICILFAVGIYIVIALVAGIRVRQLKPQS